MRLKRGFSGFRLRSFPRFAAVLFCAVIAIGLAIVNASAQQASGSQSMAGADTLQARLGKIMDRPEFKYTSFGIEFYSLDTNQVVYQLNSGKLFTPGSTTK